MSIMRGPKFCSECGEKLIARYNRRLRARAFCKKCAPGVWRSRVAPAAALALLIAISFAAGRLTNSSEPFYFIGTPLELAPDRAADPVTLAENNSLPQPAPAPTDTGTTLCGAPTKSGAPCRRRVRGGGYCFQHRDKLKPK
jgi:hypothetical protein